MKTPTLIAAALTFGSIAAPADAEITRQDFQVTSEHGIKLFVRKVVDTTRKGPKPLLLVHGARVGSIASFDVDVPGYSLAQSLAEDGHAVYLADVRGYGRSSFPQTMSLGRFALPPAVPTSVAVKDLKAIVDALRRRHTGQTLTAMGWATGSHWLAATEATHPGSIDRLVFYNSVYGGKGPWRLTKLFAKPDAPAELNFEKFGSYRLSTAKSLVGRWTKSEAISQAFIDRYVALAMSGDRTAETRTPPSFRHPSGPIADTLKAVHTGPLYDASRIKADVLILRSGNDFWSRPIDVSSFQRDLKNARSVCVRELAGASHYVHLEPSDRRRRLISLVSRFAADGELAALRADK